MYIKYEWLKTQKSYQKFLKKLPKIFKNLDF